MTRSLVLIMLLILCLVPAVGNTQIYKYIDKDGVTRYSNEPPPEGATVIDERSEIEYDEAADRAQQERNRREAAKAESEAPPPASTTANPPPAGTAASTDTGDDKVEKEYSRRKHRRKKEMRKEKAELLEMQQTDMQGN